MCVCRDGHCPSAKNGRPMVVPTMSIRGWWVVVGVDAHIDPCANMRAVEDARPYGVYPRSVRVRRGGYHPPETGDRRRRKIVLTTHLRCACPNMAYRHIPTSQRFSTIAPTTHFGMGASFAAQPQNLDGLRRRRMSILRILSKIFVVYRRVTGHRIRGCTPHTVRCGIKNDPIRGG